MSFCFHVRMHDSFDDVVYGDRADKVVVIDDGEVRDVLVLEQVEDFSYGFLGAYGEWLGAHDGFDWL